MNEQLLCAVSPLFSESCFNTQRLKVAALSSVSVFLVMTFVKFVLFVLSCFACDLLQYHYLLPSYDFTVITTF